MYLLKALTIVAISLLSTSQVLAENTRHYLEFDIAGMDAKAKDNANVVGYDSGMNGFFVKYGYDINNWLAVEGHLGNSGESDDDAPTYTIKASAIGFLGGRFNLRYDGFTLYGLAGAAYVAVTETESGTEYKTNFSSIAYGMGMDLYGSKESAITFSIIRYLDVTEGTLTTAQIGFKFYFDKPKFSGRY